MSESNESNLSDWYQKATGEDLLQGDIIKNCPFFLPPKEIDFPINTDNEQEFSLHTLDVVIMSQSCDLAPNQKPDMWQVLLCPLWSLSEIAQKNNFLGSNYGKEECRKGHMPGYHMINECNYEPL